MDGVLQHHGIRGMRWGVRRYQNADGTLTKAGEKRQNKQETKDRAKDVATRMKRDKRRMEFEDRDTGGRTSDGKAVVERIFKDLEGKEYSTEDIARYQQSRARKQTVAWVGLMMAGSFGGTALSRLGK